MKRVIIICEGETEREFCTKMLGPFFALKDIHVQSPLIKKTMGGIVKWSELKKQIVLHLTSESDVYVTTFIDYYGLYSKLNFPGWEAAMKIVEKGSRMTFLENEMSNDIDDRIRYRYMPYMQLHEFEGLLFNDISVFYEQIPKEELIGIEELKKTFIDYENPELINDQKDTAPSSRLKRIVKGYNKVVYGNYLADAIGLERIRNKCPRFDGWLHKIENI